MIMHTKIRKRKNEENYKISSEHFASNLQIVDCMQQAYPNGNNCMKMPLSKWPSVNPAMTSDEVEKYRCTWNASKTLEENQHKLADTFIRCYFDFSLTVKKHDR